jgi:hypothetical protein
METVLTRERAGRRFYPESTITLILEQVSKGHPITEILSNPAFPSESSFYGWVAADEKLAARLQAAREVAKRKGN